MAEDSFQKGAGPGVLCLVSHANIDPRAAVSAWIDANSWPQPTPGLEDEPKTILIVTGAAKDGSAFSFFAAFGYFEVIPSLCD